jgi:hypothetical protein
MKIAIATPAYGDTFYTPYVRSLFLLMRAMEQRKWTPHFLAVSYADIAESRNMLLTQWYDKIDASHLLFIDADMGFEPKLISDMVEFNKPVVGVIYPKRQLDLDRLAKTAAKGETVDRAITAAHDFVVRGPARGAARGGFIQVEGCGTGILLIQRSCIDIMLQKLPEILDTSASAHVAKGFSRIIRAFDFITVNGTRLTEDYSFCHRWRRLCGGEIWANVAHEVVHMGMHAFKARYGGTQGPRVKVIQAPVSVVRSDSKSQN